VTGLLTLPRVRARDLQATQRVAHRHDRACRASDRLALARRLVAAWRQGKVSSASVHKATQEGDHAVAALVWSLRMPMALPRCATTAFANRPQGDGTAAMLAPGLRRQLRTLLDRLVLDGDLMRVEAPAAGWTRKSLLQVLAAGWQRRCQRITAPLLVHSPGNRRRQPPSPILDVTPACLCRLAGVNEPAVQGKDTDFGLFIEAAQFPALAYPADPSSEPAFYLALREAWNALAKVMRVPILPAVIEDPMLWEGYTGEILMDACTAGTWKGDRLELTQDAVSRACQELGWDEEGAEDIIQAFARTVHASAPLRRRTRALTQSERARLTARQHALLDALHALRRHLPGDADRAPSMTIEDCGETHVGPGPHLYLRHGPSSEWALEDWYTSFDNGLPQLLAIPDAQEPSQLFAGIDRVILEAGVATRAWMEVLSYEFDRQPV